MDQAYLFGLASQRNSWLTTRQTAVAENVANADTPGYKVKEVVPFEDVLSSVGTRMVASNANHLSMLEAASDGVARVDAHEWGVEATDKNVVIEEEMLKGSEVTRAYSLNTSVMKAFHRMMLSTLKG
ncbi:flagellar basal body protein [Jiella marina]|uniref:flagellar basal body protein n=1 Tax=Jiella sp. LLJ827 TaxID=2917712 RepID=UPI0021007A56|nr:flagellar basal body protein [Jiella sp. LLJ827]MCQ0988141.1 flagellar basal body protein [Jiella sp. LLJ827]